MCKHASVKQHEKQQKLGGSTYQNSDGIKYEFKYFVEFKLHYM